MIKISRRGYKQHIRILCITSERLYNITKKNPYPKEAVCLNQILGVTCTPYKDGFMCIHTNNVHGDRGDWLAVVDHPCEFITQLFMVMGRDNNSDGFLQIKAQFTHRRRFVGESMSIDCTISTVKSDNFLIKKTNFDAITIYTP
ncbi:unnamed protein product [Rotaria magnacalcarata]|nr:unnamed protein product [Rotaria magnacalcarata]